MCADIGAMTRDEIAHVGLPLRLWAAVRQLLQEAEEEQQGESWLDGGTAGASGASSVRAAAVAAEASMDAAAEQLSARNASSEGDRATTSSSSNTSSSSLDSQLEEDQEASGAVGGAQQDGSGPADEEQQPVSKLVVPLHPDIMQRRAPPVARAHPKKTGHLKQRKPGPNYGLQVCGWGSLWASCLAWQMAALDCSPCTLDCSPCAMHAGGWVGVPACQHPVTHISNTKLPALMHAGRGDDPCLDPRAASHETLLYGAWLG